MQFNPRSAFTRAQAGLCVLAVTVGLTIAPSLLSSAGAAPRGSAASAACTAAHQSLSQAQQAQRAAKTGVVKARKAVSKAKHTHKPAKIRKAKKALTRAANRYTTAARAVKNRQSRVGSACATKPPTTPSNAPAKAAGAKLSLLGLGSGLPIDAIDAGQLTTLLDRLLPGVTNGLSPSQLTALLGGFNGGGALDPTSALALLGGGFSPADVLALLEGVASPELLTSVAQQVIGQLSGLAGGFPIPSGFDPTGLLQTFAGMFGGLSSAQLGGLLSLLTSALDVSGSAFDLGQLTGLLDSLVPGLSDQFDSGQLTSMLGALNGGGLSAATLSNLLGGQFSIAQLQSVISGTAGQALIGTVIAQVMAQLATAGGGGLTLPGPLNLSTLTGLISTVTNLLGSLLGGGGGVLPVVCGLIPIPLLCP